MHAFNTVLAALRAVAEPTRLRLLEVLTHGELTVGEISEVLDQSQPRISRHLKLLCDAGLLDRFREDHWVYYRVIGDGVGDELARHLSALIAKDDPVLLTDHRRMAAVLAERTRAMAAGTAAAVSSQLHETLIADLGNEPVGELLDIGTGTGQILRALAANASRAVGVDISTEALRIARTQAHGAGLRHCLFRRGDMYGLPFGDGTFDTVTMDRILTEADEPENAVIEAARTLRGGGRLCIVEDFDKLADRAQGNPIAALREWLAGAGLRCERVHPIDTDTAHLLIVIGRSAVAVAAAA